MDQMHPFPAPSPTLFYAPPYERPVEDEFAWHLVKYLDPRASLAYQHRVQTPAGPMWVDFMVELPGPGDTVRRIGFECGEGEEAGADLLRDAVLVGCGSLDALYRFRSDDLLYRLHDALLCVQRWDPGFFSHRGKVNLERLASPEAVATVVRPQEAEARVRYEAPQDFDDEGDAFTWPSEERRELVVQRLSHAYPAAWVRAYDRAMAHFGITPDQMAEGWRRSA